MTTSDTAAFDRAGDLADLDPVFGALSMRAGWRKLEPSLWKEPRATFRPMHWRWAQAERGLAAAGPLISTELAERRNLFLVNPIEGNHYATLRTLVCAYQMIRPGERARSHQHSPNALRLVLAADRDVYTVVDGERLDMRPNDVVLTPGNRWHGHANDGPRDAFWIDFLDVPLVHLLEPMFLEHWPQGYQEPDRANVSSQLVFSWSDVSAALRRALERAPDAACVREVLDAPSLPTMELSMTTIREGRSSGRARTTENRIVAVVEGAGRTRVGDQVFEWRRGDVMALPGWLPLEHEAGPASTLFAVSDAKMQRALGFFRDESQSAAALAART